MKYVLVMCLGFRVRVAADWHNIVRNGFDFRNIAMPGRKKGRLTLESRLVVSMCATLAMLVVWCPGRVCGGLLAVVLRRKYVGWSLRSRA